MDKHHNNSGNGFLFGILIGVLITLLFTTKKGRRILKQVTDEGMDKITNLEDLFEKKLREEDTDDMGLGNIAISKETQHVHTPPSHVTTHHPHTNHIHQTDSHTYSHHYPPQEHTMTETHSHEEHMGQKDAVDDVSTHLEDFVNQMRNDDTPSFNRPVSANRRFFRGIPKRSSN